MQDAGWTAQRLVVEALECDEGVARDATVNLGDQHKRIVGVEMRAEERRITLWSPWSWRDETSRIVPVVFLDEQRGQATKLRQVIGACTANEWRHDGKRTRRNLRMAGLCAGYSGCVA